MTKIIPGPDRAPYNLAMMQTIQPISADDLVQTVVERHPQTVLVFVRHGLQCAGCCVSPFHTIADTAREYRLGLASLLADLNRAAAA